MSVWGPGSFSNSACASNYGPSPPWDAGGLRIEHVGDPLQGTDAANKNSIAAGGGGGISKTYVDTKDELRVLKTGDTMSGALDMGGKLIHHLADPEDDQDAATRAYVLAKSVPISYIMGADAQRVRKAGDTMTGALNMDGQPINNVAEPEAPQDVATMNYVDTTKNNIPYYSTTKSYIKNDLIVYPRVTGSSNSEDELYIANESIAAGTGLAIGVSGPTWRPVRPGTNVQQVTATGGSTPVGIVTSDTLIVVTGPNYHKLVMPAVGSYFSGSTVTIVWNNTSTTGQNTVWDNGGTKIGTFAFGATATFRLQSNVSAANNWVLTALSGMKPAFNNTQHGSQSLNSGTPTALTNFYTGAAIAPPYFDNSNSFSAATGIFTCPVNGIYSIAANVRFTSSVRARYISLYVNGVQSMPGVQLSTPSAMASMCVTNTWLAILSAGDTVQLYASCTPAGTAICFGFSATLT
jgi:hypothetical protein